MKALCGFSPLSVAMLFTAALTLPILLFPFGGVLLANAAFVYGYRSYNTNKDFNIFRLFFGVTFITSLIFIIMFAFIQINEIHDFLKYFSLFGIFISGNPPATNNSFLLVLNYLFFISVFCPPIVIHYIYLAESIFSYRAPKVVSNYIYQAVYSVFPFAFAVFLMFILLYVSGYTFGNPWSNSERNFNTLSLRNINAEYMFFIITILLCYYSAIRKYLYIQLNRKY